MAAQEGRLHERRGRSRLRAAGAGPNHQLVFTDRVIATLVVLRLQLPHGALALLYGVDRSTITRAVHEVRPLLAARGFAVPGQGDVLFRTLADVFAYAAAEDVVNAADIPHPQRHGMGHGDGGVAPSSPWGCHAFPGRPIASRGSGTGRAVKDERSSSPWRRRRRP
ncbi:transposase family protein [Streptomyces sp. NBC_01443]|uniref:helix-turn-helix domain-containing protein n=1 Tax=Streptomyces sp. NBC_01443 TaxID=2903868 RepID=UPI002256DED5|nr:transposase family protein [Streptomyces sp. NBC_01443]MCX4633379.1 transposase family protein [Streptomyces sp. NBC_01443]